MYRTYIPELAGCSLNKVPDMSMYRIPLGDVTALQIDFQFEGYRNRCARCNQVIVEGYASILLWAKKSKLPYYLGCGLNCPTCGDYLPCVNIFPSIFAAIREVLRLQRDHSSTPDDIILGTNGPFLQSILTEYDVGTQIPS